MRGVGYKSSGNVAFKESGFGFCVAYRVQGRNAGCNFLSSVKLLRLWRLYLTASANVCHRQPNREQFRVLFRPSDLEGKMKG